MRGEKGRARRVRALVGVCTAVGLAAMAIAPRALSQTSPRVGATTSSTPSAVASSVGEQSTPVAAMSPSPAEVPTWIEAEAAAGRAFVYPPQESARAPRPVTVLLHGMCGHPQSACGPFVDVSTSRGWLVCPRAEDPCGGGTRWRLNGADDRKLVDASVASLAADHPGQVDEKTPRVLVGFSLGGIAAVRIAQASTGQYAGLVVIASQVHPDADQLRRAGIQRVVLAAGDMDMTSAPLQEDARRLAARGMPTRFVSLGHFGHGYPGDMEDRMREPMTWVAGGS